MLSKDLAPDLLTLPVTSSEQNGELFALTYGSLVTQVTQILPLHNLIIAARCVWFYDDHC